MLDIQTVHILQGRSAFFLAVRTTRIDINLRISQRALIEDLLSVLLVIPELLLLHLGHIFSNNIFARLNRTDR